ncbi:MAG: electron transfer flavoprotein subunit beta/FixA family protein [Deltaproteobacteria bacterium]|nr:electron transfer flavoprotein subunit beta/FixA family protein [Deltaproteobacteria bacterium]
MKILVCVKQVPEPEGIAVNRDAHRMVKLETFGRFAMNRFDEFAVEQAINIKESLSEVHVHGITVGPDRADQVLKRAVGMGCDEGIHLLTPTEIDHGPAAVAAWISQVGSGKYDLILCGTMSEDTMNGQVGPMAAGLMDLPYATQVIGMQLARDLTHVTIEREIEGGAREMLKLPLPVLLALQSGINRPRYPSLSNLLRANQKVFETISTDTLAPVTTEIDCLGFLLPVRARPAQLLAGSAKEKAEQVAALLKARALI